MLGPQIGLVEFPSLMRRAILSGNEQTLIDSLLDSTFWKRFDKRGYRISAEPNAKRLGLTEFNTWYVRGLAKRLMNESLVHCQVYRAAMPEGEESRECWRHEGQIYLVEDIYRGQRARYWPVQGNHSALSIPVGPNCHHTIRRVMNQIECCLPPIPVQELRSAVIDEARSPGVVVRRDAEALVTHGSARWTLAFRAYTAYC
jgi:hypothetical protein